MLIFKQHYFCVHFSRFQIRKSKKSIFFLIWDMLGKESGMQCRGGKMWNFFSIGVPFLCYLGHLLAYSPTKAAAAQTLFERLGSPSFAYLLSMCVKCVFLRRFACQWSPSRKSVWVEKVDLGPFLVYSHACIIF